MRGKLAKPLLVAAGVLALLVGAVLPASALDFSFQQTSGFHLGGALDPNRHTITAGNGGVEFFGPVVVPTFTPYTSIGWGCLFTGPPNCSANPAPADGSIAASDPFLNDTRSAMQVLGDSGSITVGGPAVRISRIFHKNTTIASSAADLDQVTIASQLLITDSVPPFADDPNAVRIEFNETFNHDDVDDCDDPNPGGSACDDFFNLLDPSQVFDPVFFESNGITYRADFILDIPALLTLDGVTPNGAFLVDGVFYTREGEISELHVLMQITQVVPAPASLMLLGLGLAGAALAGWRRFGA
jgi:hypothetical protein